MQLCTKKCIIVILFSGFFAFIIESETVNAIICNNIFHRFSLSLQPTSRKVRNLFPKEYWSFLGEHSHLEHVLLYLSDINNYSQETVSKKIREILFYTNNLETIRYYCHYCRRKTEGKYTRYFPVLNLFDPLGKKKYNLENLPAFIRDEEIIKVVFSPSQYLKNGNDVRQFGIQDGYHVYKQWGNKACTTAVSVMLILDRGKKVNWDTVAMSDLGTHDSIRREIEAARLTPITTVLTDSTLIKKEGQKLFESMEKLIKENGSIITGIGGEIGSHVIIVDAVSWQNRTVKIRDPYHGWQIIIKMSALLERLDDFEFIQVKREEGQK